MPARTSVDSDNGCCCVSSRTDEIDDDLGNLIGGILLYEVSAALDGGMGQSLGARHLLSELRFAAAGDRVIVGKRAQERFIEGGEEFPGLALGFQ